MTGTCRDDAFVQTQCCVIRTTQTENYQNIKVVKPVTGCHGPRLPAQVSSITVGGC